MSRPVLIVRPQPGASATASRAAALGLRPIEAPIFSIRPLEWDAPDPARYDAVLLTSANAVRNCGPRIRMFNHLPCFCVGEATAATAEEAGFRDVRIGPSDGAAAVAEMIESGVTSAVHLRGRDHVDLARPEISIDGIAVYCADEFDRLPAKAGLALAEGALLMVHSPRAAALLARLILDRADIAIAAISHKAADMAGEGWSLKAVAAAPRDEALLELAAKLCQIGDPDADSGA